MIRIVCDVYTSPALTARAAETRMAGIDARKDCALEHEFEVVYPNGVTTRRFDDIADAEYVIERAADEGYCERCGALGGGGSFSEHDLRCAFRV